MAGVFDYSTTANSNTTVGGVSIAEGMAPGNVNNAIRAEMADARKWQLDWSGIVTAGAGNAYTITSNQGVSAYADGMRISFRADRNNTGAATLNVDGRGAKSLRKVTGGALAALAADDIVAEAVYDVVYDLSSDVFVIVGFAPPTISSFALTLLDDADQAAAQATLGLVPGTNVQPQGATLTSLEGLTLAAGDILYATAADTLVRLAKGTAGQVLQMNSGATAPEWGSGSGRVLLATKTASASATLDFTEFNNATYRRYEFELENIKPASDNVSLYLRTSTDGGSNYDAGAADYTWGNQGTSGGSTTQNASASDTQAQITSTIMVGNAAGEYGVSGILSLTGTPSATVATEYHGFVTYWGTSTQQVRVQTAGARMAADDVDAVRFLFSSGNITSGTIRMYGVI